MKRKTDTSWIKASLQGVAFWIGHRQSLYSDYPLTEAAMVTEVCNLIHANLTDEYRLRCEVPFSEFLKEKRPDDLLSERARVDLIVAKRKLTQGRIRLQPTFVIEVKRLPSAKDKIQLDLQRLAAVKAVKPESRAFLFVISEHHRPIDFVSKNGSPIDVRVPIAQTNAYYRVRHSYVAASDLDSPDTAHYACLVEVFLYKKRVRMQEQDI